MFWLWVRISGLNWKRVGIFATPDDAWDHAPHHADLKGREHCVLKAGCEPNPGHSKY